jgi:RNA polymerase-binding protein DksA
MSNLEFKQMLLDLKKELEYRLERTAKHLYKRDEPYSADFAEQVVELESNQVIEQLDDEGKAELAEVNAALAKIDNGNYGACEKCQKNISDQRLQAVPYAALCIHCAQ